MLLRANFRTKSRVHDHHIQYRTSGVLPDTYILQWTSASQTGCWHYDAVSKNHVIDINSEAFSRIADKGVTRSQVELYKLIYEHEAAHSLYTVRELAELGETLKKEKIPWRLMNLFEDIRIERMWWMRQREKKLWRWTRWSKHPANLANMSPTLLLFRLKCGDMKNWRTPKGVKIYSTLPYYGQVLSYFWKIAFFTDSADSTTDLIPILKDWLKDFPETRDDVMEEEGDGESKGLGTGDLRDAIAKAGGSVERVKGESSKIGTDTAGDKVVGPPIDKEAAVAAQLENMLATAFRSKGLAKAPTSDPSKRINMKGLLRGDWTQPFIGPAITENGAPYVSILFDGSRSMNFEKAYIYRDKRQPSCYVDDAGRVLIRALSGLAAKNLIRGVVYITGNTGVVARMELPIRDTRNYSLFRGSSGYEGFGFALDAIPTKDRVSAFREITEKSKLALIYTDGCITDKPIDRASLRAKGIYTIGLCASNYDRTENLKEHFDAYISRESLFGLADALVRFLRSHKF